MRAEERLKDSIFTWTRTGDLSVEHAAIKYKNFSGAPTDYNPGGGVRTFVLLLTEDIAEELRMLGWNIKYHEPRQEGDYEYYFTEIVVRLDIVHPKIVLLTEKNGRFKPNNLRDDMVGTLDRIRAENFDVIIHPRENKKPGSKYRYKGYARAVYATQAMEDYFGGKYSDLDEYEEDNFSYNEEAF